MKDEQISSWAGIFERRRELKIQFAPFIKFILDFKIFRDRLEHADGNSSEAERRHKRNKSSAIIEK